MPVLGLFEWFRRNWLVGMEVPSEVVGGENVQVRLEYKALLTMEGKRWAVATGHLTPKVFVKAPAGKRQLDL